MGRKRTLSELNQGTLFEVESPPGGRGVDGGIAPEGEKRVFVEPDAHSIYLGATRLRDYLEGCAEVGPLRLAEALGTLDWSAFEAQYARTGRAPYAPRLMAGLVMYGLLKGVSSLRGLETLSRMDLGCMWVCGGIQPDHSNLGRFLLRHQEQFEGEFFERVTQLALRATQSGTKQVAGDGTTIQAAASRYRTLKREALDLKLQAAKQASDEDPDDEDKGAKKSKYAAADAALTSREGKRKAKGKPTGSLRVSTTEPEAPVQPLKNKSFAPSYKPSVLANRARVIVAKDVDPSDESAVVAPMLDEAERIGGAKVQQTLLDGNYCNSTILNEMIKRDIDLLCPQHGESPTGRQRFAKSDFTYDLWTDTYRCPAGEVLTARSHSQARGYVQYETSGCSSCAMRARCFSAKSTRRVIRRLPVDEAKDALREVMTQPRAREAYAKRKAMVEPVFSFMAGVMNLRRFRRRGLRGVRLDFSLHAAAYNLGRVLAASAARRLARLYGLLIRKFGISALRASLPRVLLPAVYAAA